MDETKKALEKLEQALHNIDRVAHARFGFVPAWLYEPLVDVQTALAVLRAAYHAGDLGRR